MGALINEFVNKRLLVLAALDKFSTRTELIEYLTKRKEDNISYSHVNTVLQKLSLAGLITLREDDIYLSRILINAVRDANNFISDLRYIEEKGLQKKEITSLEILDMVEIDDIEASEEELEELDMLIERSLEKEELEPIDKKVEEVMKKFGLSKESAELCLQLFRDKEKLEHVDETDLEELLDRKVLVKVASGHNFDFLAYKKLKRAIGVEA